MVTGLWFLMTLVVIGLIVHWAIVNDRSGNEGPTTGLFALKDPNPAARPDPGAVSPPGRQPPSHRG